jgi:hypothetical protein
MVAHRTCITKLFFIGTHDTPLDVSRSREKGGRTRSSENPFNVETLPVMEGRLGSPIKKRRCYRCEPSSLFRSIPIHTIVPPRPEALPLTIVDRDLERKPVPGIACNTHISVTDRQFLAL